LVAKGKAGAPKKEPTVTVRMRVPLRLYDYLGWLKRNTMKGASENDVALTILTEVLTDMRTKGYSEPPIQPDVPRTV
jgi:hypothetical protein